jgi:hypothetical protein
MGKRLLHGNAGRKLMAKTVVACALLAGVCTASLTACNTAANMPSQPGSSALSSQASSESPSEVSDLPQPSESEKESSKSVSSEKEWTSSKSPSVAAIKTEKQAADKIEKTVSLDWKRYRLKKTGTVTMDNVQYWEFEMWHGSSFQSPFILVNPKTGSVFTWAASDKALVPAAQDQAFSKTPHTFTAAVYDFTMNGVTMKTDSGTKFTVPSHNDTIDMSGLKNITYGDKVKITYTGIKNGDDMSRVFFTKVEKIS